VVFDDDAESVPVNRPVSLPPKKPSVPSRFTGRADRVLSGQEAPRAPITVPKPRNPEALAKALAAALPKPAPVVPPAPPQRTPAPPPTKKSTPVAVDTLVKAAAAPPTAAPRPATPVVRSAPAAVPPAQMTIRTMQDDVSDIQHGRVLPRATSDTAATPAPAGGTAAPAVDSSRKALPLQPTASSRAQKVVTVPAARKRKGKVLWWVGGSTLAIVLLAGMGVGAWWYLQDTATEATQNAVEAAQMLPSNAMLIVQYRLESAEARTEIGGAWGSSGTSAQLSDLIAGDPRLLLNDPELKEFFYVVLEDATRPYLIVPITPEVTKLVAAGSEVRFIEKDGWYIVHALATQPYEAALQAGTLATTSSGSWLNETGTQPLRFVFGPNFLPRLRTAVAGESFVAGELTELHLTGSFNASQSTIDLTGQATTLTTLSSGAADVSLLSKVPEQANVVRLGSTFYEDVRSWIGKAGVVDHNVIGRPVVQQLLSQLTTPYAYFGYQGPAGEQNVGLVLSLPPGLQGKVVLGDVALEEGLTALVPLIVDQPQVAPLAYADATYAGITMRYAKISGTPYALNYAVTPTHLLIATSKESMFALTDTVAGNTPSIVTGTTWRALLAASAEAPGARDVVIGQLPGAGLHDLFPSASGTGSTIPFSLSLQPETTGTRASATLLLSSIPTVPTTPTTPTTTTITPPTTGVFQ
jgi:hypothetical protein